MKKNKISLADIIKESSKNRSKTKTEEFWDDLFDSLMSSYDNLRKNQAETRILLEKKYEHVGRIISCHLVVENLINIELVNLGIYTNEKLKGKNSPRFAYKLSKLPTKNYIYVFLLPGIGQLNDIRNAYAHNLEVEITKDETFHIDKIVRLFRKKKADIMSLEKRIEEFTIFCMGAFGTRHENVRKPFSDLRVKYPTFDKILKRAAEEKSDGPDDRIYL